jgi:8-oxo-dGTP diphosphatase
MSEQKNVSLQPQVGVGVIVMRKQNGKEQVLLHRRNKVDTGKGYWGSGGGHLELGESIMEGALRELHEESGGKLNLTNVRFMGVCNFTEFAPKHYVDVSFIADWVSGEPENDKAEEAIEWQWFNLDSLPTPLYPIVNRYLEAFKSGEVFLDSKI